MSHPSIPLPSGLFEAGCGYIEREFDPNLISALDKLAEQYGPLGVAVAAATRTEPEALSRSISEMFAHQRGLWAWLNCDRYFAEESADRATWHVCDAELPGTDVATIEHRSGLDAEDSAHALAEHLNRKVILAKVAQATADSSAPDGGTE